MFRLRGERAAHGGNAIFIARVGFLISFQKRLETHTPGGRDLIIDAQPPLSDIRLLIRNVAPLHHPVKRGVHGAFRDA